MDGLKNLKKDIKLNLIKNMIKKVKIKEMIFNN